MPFFTLVMVFKLFEVYEETGLLFHGHVEFGILVLSRLGSPSFLGVEVVLALGTGQKLAAFGDFDALAIGFIGFDRHVISRSIYYLFMRVCLACPA